MQQLFLSVLKKYNNKFYLFDLCNIIKTEFNTRIYMKKMTTLQEVLIDVKESTGMTNTKIGNRVGVNETTIWRYLNGVSNTEHIQKSTADNIAKYYKSAQYKKDAAAYQSELAMELNNEFLKQAARDKRMAKREARKS
jgi:transcriptional regulator with XRE-family HTH domain